MFVNKNNVHKKLNYSINTRRNNVVKPVKVNVVSHNRNNIYIPPVHRSMHSNVRPDQSEFDSKILSLKSSGAGRVLVILACGPSILEIPVERLNGVDFVDVMVVNKPDLRVWPSKFWIFCDQTQYKNNVELFHNYTGTIINSVAVTAKKPTGQVIIKGVYNDPFSFNLVKGFNIGRSTVFAAMQVAYYMGYMKVFILGCDMGVVEVEVNGVKKSMMHFYGQNPDVSDEVRLGRFKDEVNFYENAAKTLGENCKKFYFCSKYNSFDFPDLYNRMDHTNIIDTILNKKD